MSDYMQNFASGASMTLLVPSAENCRDMKKKTLPDKKPPADEIAAVRTFSANVKALLSHAKNGSASVTQEQIAEQAGLSLRSLGYQIAGTTAPTLRTIQAVATAFGLDPWQLLLPDLPAELILNVKMRSTVRTTIRRYLGANDEDRDLVDKMAAKLPAKSA